MARRTGDNGDGAREEHDADADWLDGDEPFEPLRSPRARTQTVERAPMSRAARAQRVGRPGRPALPAHSPRPRRFARRLLALLALVLIGGALYVINATFQPFHDAGGRAVAVQIPEGADATRIGELLQAKGVVADARFFELNATLTLRRGDLRAGRYLLRTNMSNGAAIEALMQGPKVRVVETFSVTIPEGLSRREASPKVADAGVDGSYMSASGSDTTLDRIRDLGAPRRTKTAEGFLFPATYELEAGATADDLVAKQLDAYEDQTEGISYRSAQRRNLTRYDVLIIASLIEREAQLDEERPLIAAVIYNRLREGMPLGIDATIRYAERNWTQPLKRSELQKDGPYNTRTRTGLPPTPIGSPGLASLKAAARPSSKDYLFYVVKPNTCGEHNFATTDAEFQKDVDAYDRARAANGGRSPTTC